MPTKPRRKERRSFRFIGCTGDGGVSSIGFSRLPTLTRYAGGVPGPPGISTSNEIRPMLMVPHTAGVASSRGISKKKTRPDQHSIMRPPLNDALGVAPKVLQGIMIVKFEISNVRAK
jgi:hypothetical protein